MFEPPSGTDLLHAIRKAAHKGDGNPCPLLAVGGITPANARQVLQAGADGIAVISAILSSDNVEQAVSGLRMAINL